MFYRKYRVDVEKTIFFERQHVFVTTLPRKKTFKGKVYVLIGGRTISAASDFALCAKNSGNITLVGEETGGGTYMHTGQFPAEYELPNSKILVRMSFVRVNKYVSDRSVPKGSGVLPHVRVPLSRNDYKQLYYVIKMIQSN